MHRRPGTLQKRCKTASDKHPTHLVADQSTLQTSPSTWIYNTLCSTLQCLQKWKEKKVNRYISQTKISLPILDSCSGASHSDEECALVLLSSVLYLTSIEGQQGNRENLMGCCTCVGVWRACSLAFRCCCCFLVLCLARTSFPFDESPREFAPWLFPSRHPLYHPLETRYKSFIKPQSVNITVNNTFSILKPRTDLNIVKFMEAFLSFLTEAPFPDRTFSLTGRRRT